MKKSSYDKDSFVRFKGFCDQDVQDKMGKAGKGNLVI